MTTKLLLLLTLVSLPLAAVVGQVQQRIFDDYEYGYISKIEAFESDKLIALVGSRKGGLIICDKEFENVETIDLGLDFDRAYDFFVRSDDILVVGCERDEFGRDIMKACSYSYNGKLGWTRLYEKGSIMSIAEYDEKLILGGISYEGTSPVTARFLITDRAGEVLSKRYLQSGSFIFAIAVDGLRVFMGTQTNFHSYEVVSLGQIDLPTGDYLWSDNDTISISMVGSDRFRYLPIGVSLQGGSIALVSSARSFGRFRKYDLNGKLLESRKLSVFDTGLQPLDIISRPNGDYYITGTSVYRDTYAGVLMLVDPNGNGIWTKTYGVGDFFTAYVEGDDVYVGGTDTTGYRSIFSGAYRPLLLKMKTTGQIFESTVEIEMLQDNQGLCGQFGAFPMDADITLRIGGQSLRKNENGHYWIDLPEGIHSIDWDLPPYLSDCSWPEEVVVSATASTQKIRLIANNEYISNLSTRIVTKDIVRGEDNSIYVVYENDGSVKAEDVYLELRLDERLTIMDCSHEYTVTGKGTYGIRLEDVEASEEGAVRLNLSANDEVLLYTNLVVEATISSPETTVDDTASYALLDIASSCVDGKVQFEIINGGQPMTGQYDVAVLVDSYVRDIQELTVDKDEKLTISYDAPGQAVSLVIYDGDKVLRGETFEGCSDNDKKYYSTNHAHQWNANSFQGSTDKVYLQVRDVTVHGELVQEYKGAGRFHIADQELSSVDFTVRYPNLSDTILPTMSCQVFLPIHYDNRGISVTSPFSVDHSVSGSILTISVTEPLPPGEQFLCRVGIGLDTIHEESLVSVTGLFFNADEELLAHREIFYNKIELPQYSDPTPIEQIADGNLIGTGEAPDMFTRVVLDSLTGYKYVVSSVREVGTVWVVNVYRFAPDESLVWKKEFRSHEGLFKVIDQTIMEDGNLLLVGFTTFIRKGIRSLRSDIVQLQIIDKEGNQLERRFLNGSEISSLSLFIYSVLHQTDGNYLLLGTRVSPERKRYFVEVVINDKLQVVSAKDAELPDEVHGSWDLRFDKAGNTVSILYDRFTKYYMVYGKGGLSYKSGFFELPDEGDWSIFVDDYHFRENGTFSLAGGLLKVEQDTLVFTRQVLYDFDADQNRINELEVFPDYYVEVVDLLKKDSSYLVSGNWIPGDPNPLVGTQTDAFTAELDATGKVLWFRGDSFDGFSTYHSMVSLSDGSLYIPFTTEGSDLYREIQGGYVYSGSTLTSTVEDYRDARDDVQLYPNPTSDYLTVASNYPFTQYHILTAAGAEVQAGELSMSRIELADLPPGVYVLGVFTEGKTIRKYRSFVKM